MGVNTAELERYARRHMQCPRCKAAPGERCWEYDTGYARRRLLGRPHEARVDEVRKELGIEE